MDCLKLIFSFPDSPNNSLISGIYGAVVTSQNGGDKPQCMATNPRIVLDIRTLYYTNTVSLKRIYVNSLYSNGLLLLSGVTCGTHWQKRWRTCFYVRSNQTQETAHGYRDLNQRRFDSDTGGERIRSRKLVYVNDDKTHPQILK